MSFARAMITVGGLTAVSRVAGFVRDVMTAAILGAGPIADAFFIALRFPNFFRRITAEGAFSVSFIPVYTDTLTKDGEDAAAVLASRSFALMGVILGLVSALALVFMPYLIVVIAAGFVDDPLRFDMAVSMTRITFVYMPLISLAALIGGMLNAHNRFAPMAFAPVLFNLCLITALLLEGLFENTGYALSWGVAVSGVLQLFWLYLCARRYKVQLHWSWPVMGPGVRKVLLLMGPGILGAGVMQINQFADTIIASLLEAGAISHLHYGDRLHQLPLGIVGAAVGTTLLPMLSKAFASGVEGDANRLFNRAMEYCLLLALPAATGLMMLSWPIVVTLFQHGAFSWEDAVMTAGVVVAYSAGLPAHIAVKVFSPAFWARQDTRTPVQVSIWATSVNIFLSLYFVWTTDLGVFGIALATSVSGWVQVFVFRRLLEDDEQTRFDERCLRVMGKIVLACFVMAGVLYGAQIVSAPVFMAHAEISVMVQIMALAGLIAGGALSYGLVLWGSGAITLSDLGKLLRGRI